jgi:hypothetical protein
MPLRRHYFLIDYAITHAPFSPLIIARPLRHYAAAISPLIYLRRLRHYAIFFWPHFDAMPLR